MSIKQAIEALEACVDYGSMTGGEWVMDKAIAALAAMASMPAEPVHQFRVPNTCTWFDGHADHTDGGGPYEERTLYATPHTAPLSDAEIEEAVKAARHPSGTLTPTDLARAIERAVLRGGEKA